MHWRGHHKIEYTLEASLRQVLATKIGRMPLTRGSLTSPLTPSDLMTLILEARPFHGSCELFSIENRIARPDREGVPFGSCPVDSLSSHQLSNALARMKHTCLYGVSRDADDLGDLSNGSFVVIDQVDDLTMGRGQLF